MTPSTTNYNINPSGGVGSEPYGPPAPASPTGGGGSTPRPAAPVDTRSQAEKEAAFYAALNDATAAAKAGDPTKLQNFDKMFGITRDPAEYSQSFYYGSSPNDQINLINNMPISQEMKTKVIAEKLAVQAGVREDDSVENIVAWFNAGGPEDPRTVTYTNSSTQNKINVVNATNISQKAKVDVITEILSGNPDSVSNMVTYHGINGIGMQSSAANWASSSNPENQIAVVNATNISQDSKNKVIAEIRAGSNTSDTVFDKISWIENGNPPSAAALSILNPPPEPVVAPAVVEASAPAPPAPEEETAESGPSAEEIEQQKKEAEEHAKAAASQAEADEKQQQALAVATANKQSAKEARLKKIMEMRKPYMSGAASVNGSSDAMVVPPITPASQVPPPPLP
jgi:hypothetical protein